MNVPFPQPASRVQVNQKYECTKYSDCVANADYTDDKENEWEEDPFSFVVDYNGHTNRGYGSHVPSVWRSMNVPFPQPASRSQKLSRHYRY
jgi:hypothetical protein